MSLPSKLAVPAACGAAAVIVRRAAILATLVAALAAVPVAAQAAPASTPVRLVHAFNDLFGVHEGYRAVHAKGLVCEGSFIASPEARAVTRAPHMQGVEVAVVFRFSDFAGTPAVASGTPHASPRGLSLKFLLPEGSTDIVAHSYDGFPAATPEAFLGFLQAAAASGPDVAAPTPLDRFAAAHPAARRFLDHPKPIPSSYAAEAFFGVNAFRFENAEGRSVHGRYRIVPVGGTDHLDPAVAAARPADFLAAELVDRLARGAAQFRLILQIADPGDPITDGTILWPEDRRQIDLGALTIRRIAADNPATERRLLFTPLNLVDGIDTSGDPMLTARSRAYAKSFSIRAPEEQAAQ
ncbi:catalase [Constrictibacter sp. MBR-5]|jgi:catalase|uniref:catalase family peroxidase n=1 Tax=Constrictibacter sp. MBR-5 TaxID=3156467 RepID=UPI003393DBAD